MEEGKRRKSSQLYLSPGPVEGRGCFQKSGEEGVERKRSKVLLFLWCGQISQVGSKEVARQARP